jgi:hypothetical protein
MKKILFLIVAAVLMVSPLIAAVPPMTSSDVTQPQTKPTSTTTNFTHTVLLEDGMATWCSYCAIGDIALNSIYTSSDYSFYYVSMIYDRSSLAKNRFLYHYGGRAFPELFFDGGFNQTVGSGTTPQQAEALYRPLIEKAGARTVHPLEVTSTVTGQGNAKLSITVNVKNTGTTPYVGIVRSYVTEITSRWKDQQNKPIHFGFLGYALKKIVFLQPQKTHTYTVTFNGAARHGNMTYPDIVDNNIMVITTVAHIQPHVIPAVKSIKQHIAFFVDQTTAATVSGE